MSNPSGETTLAQLEQLAADTKARYLAALEDERLALTQRAASIAERYGWERYHRRYNEVLDEIKRAGGTPPNNDPPPYCKCEQCAPAATAKRR